MLRLILPLAALLPAVASAGPSRLVVLISIDTLRADRLGCYGSRVRTPHIDQLAKHGTLFTSVDSPVPLTLPAHTSLMTASYPAAHGIEENGQRVLAGTVTLASVLRQHGFRTAAFIGGYVLDARFGLNQGFDVYDSPFHLSPLPGEDPPELKRSAEAVLGSATQWLTTQSGGDLFAFIHLYDVHEPYAHGSYDHEVIYVDRAIGQFAETLAAQGLLDNTLLILTSDHGESLGEHGEDTHGYFIYESTLRVPLIFHWPAGPHNYPERMDRPASLIDIAPTVLAFLRIPAPPRFRGRNLLGSAGKQAEEAPIYAESMYARDHLGCSALRSLRLGTYKYIDAPTPELYDLTRDPGEKRNVYDQNRPVALKLRAKLLSLGEAERRPMQNSLDAETVARLRSLGYLGGRIPQTPNGPDPKARLPQYRLYGEAIRNANSGHSLEAIREFKEVLAVDKRNTNANFYVAVCLYRLQRLDDAIGELNALLEMAPTYAPALQLLGSVWLLKNDYGRAREVFERLASMAPTNYGAHYNLGMLARRDGRNEVALREFEAAIRADPSAAQAHSSLAWLYHDAGQDGRATQEFIQALALNPGDQASRKALEQIRAGRNPK
jgi:tetratricopeptide (TPR) repeat protein